MIPSTGASATPPRDAPPDPLDFDALARNIASVGAHSDADGTFLFTFTARGGKMEIFQDAADPPFSVDGVAA